ncbi:hypothetical protein [Aggregatilinea lenta]|uniref:hypothetical protein n=1 Tax=Aggregatilinea lenta TaxID=913108 RepID=UPI0013C2D4A7|nr:hypothetical protein [Aggregatilinea lenta]
MFDPVARAYIASLPEVDTARLPKNALFLAQDRIYQVIEASAGGFHKAREWRQSESTDVALIPGSLPSKYLPVVQHGHVLPVYRSRTALCDGDRPACFVFPTETLALDAAYLDTAMLQSTGAYVRSQDHEAAYAVTDGTRIFRLYYFRQTAHGWPADLSGLRDQPRAFVPRSHTEGPPCWRLLATWTESTGAADMTQPSMRLVDLSDVGGDTVPHIPPDLT